MFDFFKNKDKHMPHREAVEKLIEIQIREFISECLDQLDDASFNQWRCDTITSLESITEAIKTNSPNQRAQWVEIYKTFRKHKFHFRIMEFTVNYPDTLKRINHPKVIELIALLTPIYEIYKFSKFVHDQGE